MIQICQLQKLGSEMNPLVVVQEAFEDGILRPLSVIEAGFGHSPQASFAFGGAGGNIVADKDHHGGKA